jgi:hypothetical protein
VLELFGQRDILVEPLQLWDFLLAGLFVDLELFYPRLFSDRRQTDQIQSRCNEAARQADRGVYRDELEEPEPDDPSRFRFAQKQVLTLAYRTSLCFHDGPFSRQIRRNALRSDTIMHAPEPTTALGGNEGGWPGARHGTVPPRIGLLAGLASRVFDADASIRARRYS